LKNIYTLEAQLNRKWLKAVFTALSDERSSKTKAEL